MTIRYQNLPLPKQRRKGRWWDERDSNKAEQPRKQRKATK
jgi:hypothetical protein